MIFNELIIKGQLPSNLDWSSKLDDFITNKNRVEKYDFGKIIPVGQIEILNKIKGNASCFFDNKDNFYAITLFLVDYNDELSNGEFERIKILLNDCFGEYYLETETSFYQTHYCWHTEYIKLMLWVCNPVTPPKNRTV